MTKKIRLLIVDDSAFMRNTFSRMMSTTFDIEVIDTAKNGKEGVEKCIELEPDIITMDIEMPVMNGLDAVSEIMEKKPTPIIMISTLTTDGAHATIDALTRGAIDFIPKPSNLAQVSQLQDSIIDKIKSIANSSDLKNRIQRNKILRIEKRMGGVDSSINKNEPTPNPQLENNRNAFADTKKTTADTFESNIIRKARPRRSNISAVLIGISTGGPISLRSVIPKLKQNLPVPVFVIQHMPPNFTRTLAERLDGISDIKVKEAESGEIISAGTVYFAPGGKQMLFKNGRVVVSDITPEGELYSPSVNITLASLMGQYNNKIVSVIMTGMGSDGTKSMQVLEQRGGYNISQSPNSCVVAGMTGSAIKGNCINEIQDLEDLADSINSFF